MLVPVQTFRSYGVLLQRLLPQITQALIAGADGTTLWASDPAAETALQSTRTLLIQCGTENPADPQCLAGDGCYGFRICAAHGGPLAFVLLAVAGAESGKLDPGVVHARVKPALDCLQSELSARIPIAGPDSLGEIPAVAMQALTGVVGALLVPDCNLSLCSTAPGQARTAETELLGQLHELLLMRAQVLRRTLIANRLVSGGTRAPLPFKAISAPVFDELARVIGVLAVFRPVDAADFQPGDAQALEMLARRAGAVAGASFDLATGFLTEAAFVAQAQSRLDTRAPGAGSSGLLYLDIDQLHVINETHGMPVGDEIIHKVAQLLRSRARGGALVARLGGDRFAMFVGGCSIEPVARIAEEIRAAAIRLSGPRGDRPVLVSLSIGVARVADSDRDFRQSLVAAELACQCAKERGRNRVEVFYGAGPAGDGARGARRAAVQLASDSIRDSLELLVQPVLPLGMARGTPRFEIFMRARAADGTRLNFGKLIAADSDPQLPRLIDQWVVGQAIAQLAAQRDLLREYPAQFSLNLSAGSLRDGDFWHLLERLLVEADLPAGTIACEFSPDAALDHVAVLEQRMQQLLAFGVQFALDHVGGRIGCLATLCSLPLACIKIDGSVCRDLDRNPRSQATVLAITRLAQNFGLETIATQVETDTIRARAARLEVDFGQGFFVGRLLGLDDAVRDLPLYSCFDTSLACAS